MTNLKRIRKERKISRKQLSELSCVNFRMIEKYEMQDKDINKAQCLTVYKLAKALECNIEDLIEINKR